MADDLPEYLEAYATPEGRKGYDDTLNCVKTNFPQYVRELEGIADGANVPFHQVLMAFFFAYFFIINNLF